MTCRKLTSSVFTLVRPALLTGALAASGAAPSISQHYVSAVAADAPQLTIAYDEPDLLITWPIAGPWQLEQSPHLDDATPWSCVPLSLYQTNTTAVFISLPRGDANMFYRLRQAPAFSPSVPRLTGDWTFNDGQCYGGQDSSGYENGASLADVT